MPISQGFPFQKPQVKATLSDQGPVLPGQSQNLSVSLDSKYFGAAFGETSLSFENAELALPSKRLSGLYEYVQIPGKKDEPARFKTQIPTSPLLSDNLLHSFKKCFFHGRGFSHFLCCFLKNRFRAIRFTGVF